MASAVRDPSEAVAFLLVTVGTKTYEPIPLLEDGYYRLIHGVCVNIIHVTETSIEMTDASCADHDCIAQGIVTLENKDTREGGSYIICQQNFVTLRLCTRGTGSGRHCAAIIEDFDRGWRRLPPVFA